MFQGVQSFHQYIQQPEMQVFKSLKNHQFQLATIFANIKSALYSFAMATIDQCLEYIKIYIV